VSIDLQTAPTSERLNQPDPALDLPLAIVDVETTGLDPEIDHVIELAVILPGEGTVESLIRPRIDIFPSGVHGITPSVVRTAPRFEEIAHSLLSILRGRVIVAHNAAFDIAFLEAELRRANLSLGAAPVICTVEMARSLELGHESRSLAYACERHEIPLLDPHTARGDAAAACALIAAYAERARAGGRMLAGFVEVGPPAPVAAT
jgi:DNA polymerase-3 subunit epsilon